MCCAIAVGGDVMSAEKIAAALNKKGGKRARSLPPKCQSLAPTLAEGPNGLQDGCSGLLKLPVCHCRCATRCASALPRRTSWT